MRNLLICLFVLFVSYSNAQPYLPVLEEDNIWNVVFWSYWSGGYSNNTEITILGEEVINGKTYKIVNLDGVASNCRLREENGVVYSYEQSINDEKIMLDLNVEIGDIIDEDYFCLGGGGDTIWEYRVVDIYIDYVSGEDRKIVVIEGFDVIGDPFGYYEFWIEGIGSTNGLVPFGYNYDFYNQMTCFTRNGIVTYFNGFTNCTPTLGITNFSSEKIVLYPNPVTTTSILKLPAEISVDKIKILDIHGRIVKDETLSKEYYTIDAMDFRSGLYFYQVYSKGQLIKTDQLIIN